MLTPCEEMLVTLSMEPQPPPKVLVASHPARITLSCLISVTDESVSKRLLTCLLATIRARGELGSVQGLRGFCFHLLSLYWAFS